MPIQRMPEGVGIAVGQQFVNQKKCTFNHQGSESNNKNNTDAMSMLTWALENQSFITKVKYTKRTNWPRGLAYVLWAK